MRTEDSRAVIRIKTRELARQFETLTTRLEQLRGELVTKTEPRDRFTVLHRGLADAIARAGRVFEDASFASGVAEEIRCGTATDEMIRGATLRLEREMDRATRRAAAAILYGRLFEESESKEVETTQHLTGSSGARAIALEVLRGYWSSSSADEAAAPNTMRALFNECAADDPGEPSGEASGEPSGEAQAVFGAAVSSNEVRAHLHVIAHSFDHRGELRSYARRMLGDESAINDLSGALTILVREPTAWDFNEHALSSAHASATRINVRWNRTRWRAFLDMDLVPQLLLEAIALRLGVWARTSWLPRTLACRERKWDAFDHTRHRIASALVLPGIGQTIHAYEHQTPNAYSGAGSITGEADYFQRLFALLNADLWWNKEEPNLFIAQSDLEDFFPALPHATITTLLEVMRVPRPVIDFIVGYLRGPYEFEDGEQISPKRGMFPGNTLSRVIGDALCIALDAFIEKKSRANVTRFMDDLYWVTTSAEALEAGWTALEEFCRATGLRANRAKTTAQQLRGATAGLKTSMPTTAKIRWGFLELDSASQKWAPHAPSIHEFHATLTERLKVPGVPARQVAREYNAAVGYLVRGLAPLTSLDVEHLDRLHAPLGKVHANVVDVLRANLTARYETLGDLIAMLPSGWFYWPVTAGGLGLYNPASMLAGARATLTEWQRANPTLAAAAASPAPSGDSRNDGRRCGAYETQATVSLRLSPPVASPEMAGRERDFIARGMEMRGMSGGGGALHPYWQWLLETHGPSLIDVFGTLRFLPKEVVPVDPIVGAPAAQSLLTTGTSPTSVDDDIPF